MHPAIPSIVKLAQRLIAPKKIWLFGSRARGTERPTSDIDLAFEFANTEKWSTFVAEVQENAPTLLDIDLVDMTSCSPELREEILSTGKLLHG